MVPINRFPSYCDDVLDKDMENFIDNFEYNNDDNDH